MKTRGKNVGGAITSPRGSLIGVKTYPHFGKFVVGFLCGIWAKTWGQRCGGRWTGQLSKLSPGSHNQCPRALVNIPAAVRVSGRQRHPRAGAPWSPTASPSPGNSAGFSSPDHRKTDRAFSSPDHRKTFGIRDDSLCCLIVRVSGSPGSAGRRWRVCVIGRGVVSGWHSTTPDRHDQTATTWAKS